MENQIIKIQFDQNQVELIKKQIAPNANDNELKLFLYQAQRTGLDPLTRQIYCIHRGGKMTIQTSIDGFRVIAERSGDYAGQDEPVFIESDGKIISCKVAVYRFRGEQRYQAGEQRYQAAVGVAFMSEFNAGGPMWAKMPHTMLSKCAEAVALRKAYPQDLSGLYTGDEMAQADAPSFEEVPTPGEIKMLIDMVYSSTLTDDVKEKTLEVINGCTNYEMYQKLQFKLEGVQQGFDDVANPSQKDITNKIKKIIGHADGQPAPKRNAKGDLITSN
jgi:phage recombination protein Bet